MKPTLRETVKYRRVTATDGELSPRAAAVTVLARVERSSQFAAMEDSGERLDYAVRIFTEVEIQRHDLVFLPEDDVTDEGQGRQPKRVTVRRDLNGVVSHYEVLL